MNIFILDIDPKLIAEYHCDKHVVKMILETAQLLSTAHWKMGKEEYLKNVYKPTHKNHPCAKWVIKSEANYNWLANLGMELCKEYTFRYEKIHKSQKIIEWCSKSIPCMLFSGDLTPFVQAMPDKYKNSNVVQAYRDYYNGEKRHLFSWKKREKPYWIF